MGLISKLLVSDTVTALGKSVTGVAEVFRPNATKQLELGHKAYVAALSQHGTEFENGRVGWFDRLMNGLNRLPRPMLALGTLGLFVFAMINPVQFSDRMQGLAFVPEPLWWLLGAIVSFYFGARELHYKRELTPRVPAYVARHKPQYSGYTNPALADWKSSTDS